ncbi:hypothetical protein H0H81_008174 [Sphagnurus paluster]|uniref:Uncharacterized protein n=1 Tax=Sphagnurus paluster TaxID=117069 RepID=A0A9P7FW78_9AGAR|nr:hypothetical protein H0H81_008174 [Sphagnurus paluster]
MFLQTAKDAAKEAGLSEDRIVLTESGGSASYPTLDELVKYGSSIPVTYTELRFKPGEAKTTIAFLSFSSGTTGKKAKGLTETCTSIALVPPTQHIATIGSAGQLIPGIIAKVVKPDGSLASEGEQGELVVTGPSMALGYLNNDAATKETFVDGWVHTGDEVIIKNCEVFVVDRLKEIMKVRGFQVAPAELEGHLLMHPDVSDVCVVSIPDDYSGELPLAYIVLTEAASRRVRGNAQAAAQLKIVLAKHVADAKVPYKHLAGGIEFIDVIPKNASGKMLRRVLKEQARKLKVKDTDIRAKL